MKRWSSLTDKKEELEKRVKRLEKQLKQQQTQQHEYNHSSDEPKEYSRRSFLKALGGGAAGLGAAAMIGNASAFRINSDQGLSYFNRSSNQSQFNVSPDGTLDVNQIGTNKNPVKSVHSKTTSTGELFVGEANGIIFASETIPSIQGISAALDEAATRDRATVHIVGEGTHQIAPKQIQLNNVTITASDDAIWQFDGSRTSFALDLAVGSGNVTIKNVEIDFNGSWGLGLNGDNVTVKNCDLSGWGGKPAIQLGRGSASMTNLEICDCSIHDNVFGGVIYINADLYQPHIFDNRFESLNDEPAIKGVPGVPLFGGSISDNTFVAGATGISSGIDIVARLDNTIINGNDFDGVGVCISVSPYDGSVCNNTGSNVGESGIIITNGRDSTISNNTMEKQSLCGILLQLTQSDPDKYANAAAAKHTVQGNTVSGSGEAGIRLAGAAYCSVVGNESNQNSEAASDTYSGIELRAATPDSTTYGTVNCIVGYNVCTDTHDPKSQSYGISESADCDYNFITNNHLSGNLTGALNANGPNSTTSPNMTNGA